MSNEASLILFFADGMDDADAVNALVEQLYGWNALHVQVLPAAFGTSSSRHTFLLEVPAAEEWRFAQNLARDYGIARYHRLASTLCYQPVNPSRRPIVATCGGSQVAMTVRFDLIGTVNEPLHVRVQGDDLAALHSRLVSECGQDVSANTLRQRLEALLAHEDGFVLDLSA